MIAAWMVYSCLVAGALGLAALAAERAVALYRRPARLVWLAGMLGSLAFPLLAQLHWVGTAPAGTAVRAAPLASPGASLGWVASAAAAWDRALLLTWGAASLLLLGALALSLLRLRRERSRWSPRAVNGWPVEVAPDLGPALVGLASMAIVIPRWFFELPSETQRLALLHEREHLKAGDARLLILGLALAALVPWNFVVWWQLRRLRAAVELDCDERVLRAGAHPGAYAHALLDVGARQRGSMIQPALAEPQSLLSRRIDAMLTKPGMRRAWMRAGAYTTVVAGLLALACEAPAPEHAVGPGETPVVSREGAAGAATAPSAPIYVVDGHRLPAGEGLRRLDPARIARVEILKGDAAAQLYGQEGRRAGVVEIYMKDGTPLTVRPPR